MLALGLLKHRRAERRAPGGEHSWRRAWRQNACPVAGQPVLELSNHQNLFDVSLAVTRLFDPDIWNLIYLETPLIYLEA
jgi:hypothetical protein